MTDAPQPVPDTSPDPMPALAPEPPAASGPTAPPEPTESSESAELTGPTDPTGTAAPTDQAAPADQAAPTAASGPAAGTERLFDPAEAERFRERWHEVQSAFVDDPGGAVRRADELAAEAAEALGRALAARRRSLSDGLDGGAGADTERLRLALRGYRDLLDRVCAG
ncbi:hypothetical protein AB0C74_07020 [Spirillospora sp. NPDC048832]